MNIRQDATAFFWGGGILFRFATTPKSPKKDVPKNPSKSNYLFAWKWPPKNLKTSLNFTIYRQQHRILVRIAIYERRPKGNSIGSILALQRKRRAKYVVMYYKILEIMSGMHFLCDHSRTEMDISIYARKGYSISYITLSSFFVSSQGR